MYKEFIPTVILVTMLSSSVAMASTTAKEAVPVTAASVTKAVNNKETKTMFNEMTTGLKYKIVTEGAGEQVSKAGDKVHVHYTGWLADAEGNKLNEVPFDSSVSRGVPFDFKLGAGYVISGWDLGVAGMKIGEKRLLLLAPEMGYGDRGAGGAIPPKSTLIFEVELLKVG